MSERLLEIMADRRFRLGFCWLVLLVAFGHRGGQAWINFEREDRPDGNDGHTAIDFGGQWMMGRLLVLGHGRELYSRPRHLEVARQAYRHDREAPNQDEHDAERLISFYPGYDDNPVGGPLYPPIHAFVMAPLGLIDDPYLSYRVYQAVLLGITLLAGLGIRWMTGGRWWWVAATSLVLLYPGCRGGIDLGQNSPLTLCVLVWGWACLVHGRPTLAGVLWGLLAFKPIWAVSFLAAFVILGQWRAAIAMCAIGLAQIALTIPFVGVQAWFDWLTVGGMAAETYRIDRNWIFLSRDLFGIPRRILLDFDDGRAVSDKPIAGIAGWLLWSFVAGTTLLIAIWRRNRSRLFGPLPAFVLLGMWVCAYRFMYYDALLALIGVVVLLRDPRPFFRLSWWPFASAASVLVGVSLLIENVTAPANVQVTASVMGLKGTGTAPDGSTHQTAPRVKIASGDEYPWDTLAALGLWAWCGIQLIRSRTSTEPSIAPSDDAECVGRTPVDNSD